MAAAKLTRKKSKDRFFWKYFMSTGLFCRKTFFSSIIWFGDQPICNNTEWVQLYGFNPLTAGAAYIRVFVFYRYIKYHILNMSRIKCDINQQDLKRVDLHFVKTE